MNQKERGGWGQSHFEDYFHGHILWNSRYLELTYIQIQTNNTNIVELTRIHYSTAEIVLYLFNSFSTTN
jgi:hypothetical protein